MGGGLCLAPADELNMRLLFAEGTSIYVSAIWLLIFPLVKGASGSIFTKGLGWDRCVCCFCLTLCFKAGVEGVVEEIPRSIRPLPPHTETVIIFQPHPGPLLCMHGQDVIHVSYQLATPFSIPFGPDGCISHTEVQPFTN